MRKVEGGCQLTRITVWLPTIIGLLDVISTTAMLKLPRNAYMFTQPKNNKITTRNRFENHIVGAFLVSAGLLHINEQKLIPIVRRV